MDKTIHPNRNYQDSVFSKLFSNEEAALELYNALSGTNYGPETKIRITTLENVLFLEKYNDLSFTVEDRIIVMAEHQSTINPNIPLRLLGYSTDTYTKIIDTDRLYSSTQVKLPTPVFYVFYTGNEPWNVKTLSLADSFIDPPPENSLNLVVKLVNLRYNKDNEILNRSKTLMGYSKLVTYVKEDLSEGKSLRDSIRAAVQRCICEGHLVDFLKKHGEEIEKMKFYEFTLEEYRDLIEKEAAEQGLAQGIEQGLAQGIEQGLDEGIKVFILDNRTEGVSDERILTKLMNLFHLSEEKALEYLK
ncbi:Rpn family recombination-promoting nuclease/putative transposase [Anaerovoracaceae bacterium 42-11]